MNPTKKCMYERGRGEDEVIRNENKVSKLLSRDTRDIRPIDSHKMQLSDISYRNTELQTSPADQLVKMKNQLTVGT
jgi:hypothetical protein